MTTTSIASPPAAAAAIAEEQSKLNALRSTSSKATTSSSTATTVSNGTSQKERPPQQSDEKIFAAEKSAFLSNDEIAASFTWRAIRTLFYLPNKFINDITVEGVENLPPLGEGALLVSMHSTHNQDILPCIVALQEASGQVIRGLFHKRIITFFPWLRYVGGVPGTRDTARLLLQQGHLVAVIPGGGEEAMRGHEHSYDLYWQSSTGTKRQGFAATALSTGKPVRVLPIYMRNGEEMRFNIFFFIWNLIGGSLLWDYILELSRRSGIKKLTAFIFSLGAVVWFTVALLGIPVPVQTTLMIGEPIIADPASDTPEIVVQKTKDALQGLVDRNQPSRGKNYMHGLKARQEVRRNRLQQQREQKLVTEESKKDK